MTAPTLAGWPRATALDEARTCWDAIRPVVERGLAVGSLRRRRPTVHDIEFLVEPRILGLDLTGAPVHDLAGLHGRLAALGAIVKHGDRYVRVRLPSGMQLDAFICHPPATWGVLAVIRTGPAALGKLVMQRLIARGYRCEHGQITRVADGAVQPTETEDAVFVLADLPHVPATQRDALVARFAEGRDS